MPGRIMAAGTRRSSPAAVTRRRAAADYVGDRPEANPGHYREVGVVWNEEYVIDADGSESRDWGCARLDCEPDARLCGGVGGEDDRYGAELCTEC